MMVISLLLYKTIVRHVVGLLKISLADFQTDINTDMGVEALSGFFVFWRFLTFGQFKGGRVKSINEGLFVVEAI